MEKALIAMSGGVDSSVAAYLARQQYECLGATMVLCDRALLGQPSVDSAADARDVAERLGMEFYALTCVEDFRRQVVEPFICAYEAGLTPNPCIQCNRQIKFGLLLEKALALGCQKLVTGHYARVEQDAHTGRYVLRKAADTAKDQTYFLSRLTQQQLRHVVLPLGDLTKEQVRQLALEQGFVNARKRDSQDICFIPDGDYMAFLERYTGKQYPGGQFVDLSGKPVGQHSGAIRYTLGQRKGLGLAMGAPVYVCGKDMASGQVTVGPNEALFSRQLLADDWCWQAVEAPTEPLQVKARIRYRHTEQPATVYPESNGIYRVIFEEPQRAITPGQTVTLYDGDTVLGGGTIL